MSLTYLVVAQIGDEDFLQRWILFPSFYRGCLSVTLLLSLTSGLLGVNKMSMQRIGLQMRSLAPATLGEFEKERTRIGPK